MPPVSLGIGGTQHLAVSDILGVNFQKHKWNGNVTPQYEEWQELKVFNSKQDGDTKLIT